MKKYIVALCLIWTQAAFALTLGPSSKLWLDGKSNIHPYSSTATSMEVSGSLQKFQLNVSVAGLKSGKKGLDKNLYKAMKSSEYPFIRFNTLQYKTKGPIGSTPTPVHISGKLFVAGREKTVALDAKVQAQGKVFHVEGSKELLMSDFGIEPPTAFFGALKTDDKIIVHFDLFLSAD